MPKLFCLEITISSSLSQYGKILSFEIFFEYKKNLRRWPKCYVAVVVSKKMTSFMPAYSDGFRDGHAFLVSLSCLPSILGPMECKFFTGSLEHRMRKNSRVGQWHTFFSIERNVLAFFYVLYKRPRHSLRSFTFFIKECGVLCVLLRSL